LSERARVRRHYGPLCSTLVAAKSGSICIAVVLVSVSGGVIVLGDHLVGEVAAAEGYSQTVHIQRGREHTSTGN